MVLYHGTSSVGAESIESHGLRSKVETASQNDMDQVVNLYKSIGWSGQHLGGFAVLGSFSTFDKAQDRPVYLAESEHRALLYATRDFACGERARALFYSVEDLLRLLNDPDAQGQYKQDVYRQITIPAGRPGTRSVDEITTAGLEALRSAADELERIRRQLAELRNSHTHGVIYAVELQPRDVLRARLHSSMGIIFPGDLGPDRLLAKVRVPPTLGWMPMQDNRRLKIHAGVGSFGALRRILESVVGTNPGWADNDEVLAQIVRLIKQEIQL